MALAVAAEHTERIRLGTAVAIAFARNPMNLANLGYDLQSVSGGRFVLGLGTQVRPHIEKRFSATWSHPARRLREIVLAGRADRRRGLEVIAVVGPREEIASKLEARLDGIADAVSLTHNRCPDPGLWADVVAALRRTG